MELALRYAASPADAPAETFSPVGADQQHPADLILGFGCFDTRIPERCAELFHAGVAPLIFFTGGRGAGTADVEGDESVFFRGIAVGRGVPEDRIMNEVKSTHTGNNVDFTREALADVFGGFDLPSLHRVVIVSTPYRLRRVWLTCRQRFPSHLSFVCNSPPTNLEKETAIYAAKGLDLSALLKGEVERIRDYGAKGWCVAEEVPAEVLRAVGLEPEEGEEGGKKAETPQAQ